MIMHRVLIVDDKEENLYLLRALLQGYGYKVEEARQGAEALVTARQNPPDLIIADILMPVMDGFTLCREWKKDEHLKSVPFIFYTASYTDERDRKFALSLGAERFIIKPKEPDAFMTIVRETLQQVEGSPTVQDISAAAAPIRISIEAPEEEEIACLKQYNEVLIHKMETKMEELEQANRELEKDIAERKQTEMCLRQTADELIRSNKDLENFAHAAAHDLQEPLRMVCNFTQLLAKRYKEKIDSDANDYIDFIIEGTERMSDMISGILEYSHISSVDRILAPTDCEFVLSEALAALEQRITSSNTEITRDPLPTVGGDQRQLTQLFQNLVDNAIKFRSDALNPHIHVSACEQNGYWLFSVRDNGIGIDPQYQEKIFEIFQRLHGPREYPGAGIGLALCKRIVERHGGRIWFEPRPGKGTTFFFTLPRENKSW